MEQGQGDLFMRGGEESSDFIDTYQYEVHIWDLYTAFRLGRVAVQY